MRRFAHKYFYGTSAVILCIAAIGKATLLFSQPALALSAPNPLFLVISERWVMVGAVVLELGVAALLFSRIDPATKLFSLSCLCSILWIYRVGRLITGATGSCACIAGVQQLFGLTESQTDVLALALLGCMTAGCIAMGYTSIRTSLSNRTNPICLSASACSAGAAIRKSNHNRRIKVSL